MPAVSVPPNANPDSPQQQDLENNEAQAAHEAAPNAAVAVPSEENKQVERLTSKDAALEMVGFWPFLLRIGVSAAEQAALSWIIAQESIELVGAFSAYQSLIGLATGLLYASIFPVNTLISEARKKEEDAVKEGDEVKANKARQEIQLIWRQGILFATGLSAIALAFGFSSSGIFKLMEQPEVVQEHSKSYMLCATPGFVADMFYRLTARTTTGLGVRKSVLVGDVLDNIAEASLSYLLLNGVAGLPKLGLAGVGLAYTISKVLTLAGHLAYMYASPKLFKFDYAPYQFFDFSGPMYDKKLFNKLISAGIPDGVSSLTSSVASMLVVMFCGHSGVPALVGNQAASVYSQFSNFHLSTVFNIATNRIGQYNDVFRNKEVLVFKDYSVDDMKALQALVTQRQEKLEVEAEKTFCEKIQNMLSMSDEKEDSSSDNRKELYEIIANVVLTEPDIRDTGLTDDQLTSLQTMLKEDNRADLSEKLVNDQWRYTAEDKAAAADNVKLYTKLMAGVCVGLSILSFTLAFAMTKQLATLLVDEHDASQQAHLNSAMNFLKIQGVFELIGAVGAAPSCTLEGMLDNAFMLKLSLISEVAINIIAAVVARFGINKGGEYVFASSGVGLFVYSFVSLVRFFYKTGEFSVKSDADQAQLGSQSSLSTPLLSERAFVTSSDGADSATCSQRSFRSVRFLQAHVIQQQTNNAYDQSSRQDAMEPPSPV